MPRTARSAVTNGYFHVIVQGIDKERIFDTPLLKGTYLKLLSAYKKDYDVAVITFCIMGNHAHLLLHANDTKQLSAFMHRVNTRFAGTYNKLLERVGYVFRDRFRSQAIFDIDYAMNCMVYIHNNPVKVGIAQNAADYTFSGLRCYLERRGAVDFDRAAELFDTDAENVEAIMQERSASADECCPVWADIKDEEPSHEEIAAAIIARFNTQPALLRHDKKKFVKAVELMRAAGIPLTEAADYLCVSRPTLYSLLR